MPEAAADLRHARSWYDDIRPELGERFAVAVDKTIEAIAEHPLQFPVVHRGRRRTGVRRFHGIFFEIQTERIVVIASSTPSGTRSGGICDKFLQCAGLVGPPATSVRNFTVS